jgi:ribosomal protein S18 acetylase RimI-like enzyme
MMDHKPGYKQIPVKTWFLIFEGNLPDLSSLESIQLEQWRNPEAGNYLELYKEVGAAWGWTGRLLISPEELTKILHSDNNEVWLFLTENQVAGFFELVRSENETKIVYLGLKPEWLRKGLGQKLIHTAVAVAGRNNHKVWLHTCDQDHPAALKAYLKAGFTIEKELVTMEFYPE